MPVVARDNSDHGTSEHRERRIHASDLNRNEKDDHDLGSDDFDEMAYHIFANSSGVQPTKSDT